MTAVATRPGSNGRARPSLGDQLDRLDGILNGLSDARDESVTGAVSAAVGKAVREALESAARELAARAIPPATPTDETDVNLEGRHGRGMLSRLRAAGLAVCARVGRMAASRFCRLGTPVVTGLIRAVRTPRRFTAFALAGVVAGTAAGSVGPLLGAALCGWAAFAIAVGATPRE
jgi:hypothetical protein